MTLFQKYIKALKHDRLIYLLSDNNQTLRTLLQDEISERYDNLSAHRLACKHTKVYIRGFYKGRCKACVGIYNKI